MDGDETAEIEIEKWDKCIKLNPDYLKKQEAEAKAWEKAQAPLCEAALRRQRSITPIEIAEYSVQALQSEGARSSIQTRTFKIAHMNAHNHT